MSEAWTEASWIAIRQRFVHSLSSVLAFRCCRGWTVECRLELPRTISIQGFTRPAASKTRIYHGRVGAGRRTTGWPGGAEPGSSGRRPIGSTRRQPFTLSSRASKRTVLNVSRGARTSETPCKPMRDDGRASFLVADQCTDDYVLL